MLRRRRQWLEKIGADLSRAPIEHCSAGGRSVRSRYPEFASNWETASRTPASLATRLALFGARSTQRHPRARVLRECDDARFQTVKPLLWLWYSFDRTKIKPPRRTERRARRPLRRVLAPYIFKRCGENFKHFNRGVLVRLQRGSRCDVVHPLLLLDDRGGNLLLGNKCRLHDYANIYSHTPAIVDQRDVTAAMTRLRRRRASHLPCDGSGWISRRGAAMVGSMAVATMMCGRTTCTGDSSQERPW